MHHRYFLVALMLGVLLTAPLSGCRRGSGDVAAPADRPSHVKAAEPAHISRGQEIALADHLVPDKTTIFDFYSEYCPPCRRIAPYLANLHETRADIAVVKVDINRPGVRGIDWSSPVARQYRLESVPHFKIYGPDGRLQAEGDPAYETILRWLKLQPGAD